MFTYLLTRSQRMKLVRANRNIFMHSDNIRLAYRDSSVVRAINGLVIERSRVRVPAGMAGEFYFSRVNVLC